MAFTHICDRFQLVCETYFQFLISVVAVSIQNLMTLLVWAKLPAVSHVCKHIWSKFMITSFIGAVIIRCENDCDDLYHLICWRWMVSSQLNCRSTPHSVKFTPCIRVLVSTTNLFFGLQVLPLSYHSYPVSHHGSAFDVDDYRDDFTHSVTLERNRLCTVDSPRPGTWPVSQPVF